MLHLEKFTQKHIDEATSLAVSELESGRVYCPDIPGGSFAEEISGMLNWLSNGNFGAAALYEGRLVGYMLFGGPWDGFFGNVKGAFCPLGASAFSYAAPVSRERLASMTLEYAAARC